MQSNTPIKSLNEQLADRKKQETKKLQKLKQEKLTPIYCELMKSLRLFKQSFSGRFNPNDPKTLLPIAFNPVDCNFYEVSFEDSKSKHHFRNYIKQAKNLGLNVSALEIAYTNLQE